jgi:endonuclease-3
MLSTEQLSFRFGATPPPRLATPAPSSALSHLRQRLMAIHGSQRAIARTDPVDQFVGGIIASRTREDIAFPTFKRLWHRFKSWDAVSRATFADIERVLRPVTHAERKAAQIPAALRAIVARTGRLDLRFLADWPADAAMAWLMDLPGAGPKVAAATLNFSTLRKRVLVVDTRLLRLGKRLGLLPETADYKSGHDLLMRLVPDDWDADDLFEFHWLMKRHGQKVCFADSPACFRCPLRAHCSRGVPRH